MELIDLVGEHTLNHAAVVISSPFNTEASGIAFFMDGMAYLALEDPSDGYRSSLGIIFSAKADPYSMGIHNYESINRKVVCKHVAKTEYHESDILEIVDSETGHTWLRVGTDNSDDYYPSFVSEWNAMPPEKETA